MTRENVRAACERSQSEQTKVGFVNVTQQIADNRCSFVLSARLAPVPTQQPRAVLLCLDGVVHDSDLPVQSFARHITEQLSAERIRPVIAGMRGFLEDKPELIPPDIDLSAAEDGYQAVEILARTVGLDDAAISGARRASRADLAASAWAVDPADGLDALLAEIDGTARVLLLTEPGDPAARPVLASIDLTVDEIVYAPVDLVVTQVLRQLSATTEPDRLLLIGTRWAGQLADAHNQGCRTAQVDRFGRGRGNPTYRRPGLAELLDEVRDWLCGRSRPAAENPTTRTAP
jgi:hypothetical protein